LSKGEKRSRRGRKKGNPTNLNYLFTRSIGGKAAREEKGVRLPGKKEGRSEEKKSLSFCKRAPKKKKRERGLSKKEPRSFKKGGGNTSSIPPPTKRGKKGAQRIEGGKERKGPTPFSFHSRKGKRKERSNFTRRGKKKEGKEILPLRTKGVRIRKRKTHPEKGRIPGELSVFLGVGGGEEKPIPLKKENTPRKRIFRGKKKKIIVLLLFLYLSEGGRKLKGEGKPQNLPERMEKGLYQRKWSFFGRKKGAMGERKIKKGGRAPVEGGGKKGKCSPLFPLSLRPKKECVQGTGEKKKEADLTFFFSFGRGEGKARGKGGKRPSGYVLSYTWQERGKREKGEGGENSSMGPQEGKKKREKRLKTKGEGGENNSSFSVT